MNTDLLFEHFDTLATAPEGVARLREMILQLAVQGKLGTQDERDEPASVLLKRIQGKLSNNDLTYNRKFPQNPDIEIPSPLPEKWIWVHLGEIAIIKGGKRLPPSTSFSEVPTRHIYIRISNMKNGSIDDNELTYVDDSIFQQIKHYTISKDDIYITIAGTIGEVGEVPDKFHEMCLTENAAKVIFKEINKKYLILALRSKLIQIQLFEKTNTQAQPKLALKRIRDTLVPLPPLAEQHRIVERVDRLMVLCDELEARQQQERAGCLKLGTASLVALQNAESPEEFEQLWAQVCDAFELILDCPENVEVLRQTILQLAVQGQLNTNDPSDNPIHIQLKIPINCLKICELHNPFHDNWIVTSIANISKKVVDGVHKTPTYRSRGIPFLTVKNLTKGKNIDYSDVKYISREEHLELIQRTKPEKNDILITKDGTIGVTRKIREDIEFSIFVTLALVKPIDPDISDYLEIALSSPQIQNNMLRTGSGLKHLVLRDINRLLIPIPPLAEQRRIVAKVNKLIEVCDLLERHLKGYEEMQGRFANAIISKIAGKVN